MICRPDYGDDDFGDGYQGNLPHDQRREPEHYDGPKGKKATTKKGRFDNRANRGNPPNQIDKRPTQRGGKRGYQRGARVRVREAEEDGGGGGEWGERFARYSNDARFPFTVGGFLKVAQMVCTNRHHHC